MITASFFIIEMRGKTENIYNTIFTQFTTFLSIMSLYGQSKKIFYLLLVLRLIIPLQAQRQSRSARHLKNGEYKARRTAVRNPNFPDTRNVEGLDNISFNYSSSLQTIANNEHLIQMATKRKLRR